jgi:hypothetical protein
MAKRLQMREKLARNGVLPGDNSWLQWLKEGTLKIARNEKWHPSWSSRGRRIVRLLPHPLVKIDMSYPTVMLLTCMLGGRTGMILDVTPPSERSKADQPDTAKQ